MENYINIIIAEDKILFRDIMVKELAVHNINTIAEANNGEELLNHLRNLRPDVVLLDLEMPVMDGNKTMQVLASNSPWVKVIILSTHYENTLVDHFINMGAKGFVPKDTMAGNIQVLVDAIQAVKNSEIYVYHNQQRDKRFVSPGQQILPLLRAGKSNRQISDALGIKERIIEKLRLSFYDKNHNGSGVARLSLGEASGIIKGEKGRLK